MRLIHRTGGIAVLAHPWSLKNPSPLIDRLKDAGLDGMEVYRSGGKDPGMILQRSHKSAYLHELVPGHKVDS